MQKINRQQPENLSHIAQIQRNADYQFKNISLLLEALTHPSYAAEHANPDVHNQRLEFLGDAVLQIIISDHIYRQLPGKQEGTLTRVRSFLANEQATAQYTLTLQLDQALMLGHGEDRNGGRKRPSILGDLFEAFLGAIYLDGGIEPATKLVMKLLPDLNYCLHKLEYDENPKGALQHFCLEHYQEQVHYQIIAESGPTHDKVYTAQVTLKDKVIGKGSGKSHKEAEKAAASAALEQLAQVHVTQEDLPIPMEVPQAPPKQIRKIIALDFDGVLCNSETETANAAWNGMRLIWPDVTKEERLPEDIHQKFTLARPYLETGYQSILMMKLLLDGKKPDFFQTDFAAKIAEAVKAENLTVARLIKAFGDARDQAIGKDLDQWLALHEFYPGAIQALKQAMAIHKVLILTTKQERFIKALLKSQDVDFPAEAIFGLDRKLSKDAVLANLVGAKKSNIHFVEDRLDTLLRIQQSKALTRVKLHYAPWGYGTPEQLQQARNLARIDVLTPESFQELLAR